jgi:DsbC/DsbD-like thiol-disulfide interchange protein
MGLVVGLHYGICKDICVPIEAELVLEVPANEASPISEEARQALDRVPRAQDKLRAGDPALVTAKAVISGASPKITIEARFPEGDANANVYVEAPGGLYLPIPELVGANAGGGLLFEALLGVDVDLDSLKGKQVTVTLVGPAGASVATFPVE